MKNNDVQKLGTWPIPKLLISMAAPIIVAFIINGMYFVVDAAFVGWGVGVDALGGLAVVMPIVMLETALGTMLGVGSGSLISLELGKNNMNKANRIIKSSLMLAILFGLISSIFLILFKNELIVFMGGTDETFFHAKDYYLYIVPGIIFVLLSMVELNTLRAEGKAKIASIGMISGALINTVLDPLFIFGFHMGTGGAAIATVIARFLVTIYLTRIYINRESILDIRKGTWVPDFDIVKKIITLGSGVFLNQISFSILAIVMNLSLLHYGEILDISIYGIISRLYIFITMPFLGLANGFQPVAGYNYSSGNHRRTIEAIETSVLFSILLGSILLILFEVFPAAVLRLFTNDIQTIERAIPLLRITMVMVPIVGIQIISYIFFLAIDKPIKAIFLSLSRQLIFLLPLILILPVPLGIMGLWIAYPIADVISVGVSYLMLTREKRAISTYFNKNKFEFTNRENLSCLDNIPHEK